MDGDIHQTLKPGDEEAEEYKHILDYLYTVQKSNKDILYVYTYAKHDENKVTFIVDASYGHEDDSARIGEIYESTTPVMLNSFVDHATAEKDFTTDKWGTYLSA